MNTDGTFSGSGVDGFDGYQLDVMSGGNDGLFDYIPSPIPQQWPLPMDVIEDYALKVKFLDGAIEAGAKLPESAHDEDAGYDVTTITDGEVFFDDAGRVQYIEYRSGIAIEPPLGHHVEILPRSSNSKKNLILSNGIGLVDEGYRGEIIFRFKIIPYSFESALALGSLKPVDPDKRITMLQRSFDLYRKGDKIAQFVIRKTLKPKVVAVQELSSSQRGAKGWGSSGR